MDIPQMGAADAGSTEPVTFVHPSSSSTAATSAAATGATQSRDERMYPDDQPEGAGAPLKHDQQPAKETAEAAKPDTGDYQLQVPEGVQIDQDL